LRGWLAAIAKERRPLRQLKAYRGLITVIEWFNHFRIVPFDEIAATRFDELRSSKIRIGSMDLKIAATALANGCLLLTANRIDFERVPGLRFENWID